MFRFPLRKGLFFRLCSVVINVCFISTFLSPSQVFAQSPSELGLPNPGSMVSLTPSYVPLIIKGLRIHPENPVLFDFLVDTGHSGLSIDNGRDSFLRKESERLIKYFLASLTIPEEDVWVNLSPYEKDRIVPDALGQTEMGRDMLAQDYILKQLTASLIYPEKELGKEFWTKVYSKAQQLYGSNEIPVNTFNKVWIVADKAKVYVHDNTAFVVSSHLKVMLEEDYEALNKNNKRTSSLQDSIKVNDAHALGSQIVREIVLPELEKEVNSGKNFANLRQIFNSMILATWYKKSLKEAFLNQVYSNKSKINGVDVEDKTIKEQIYQEYLRAYKKGVFNYIKEDIRDGQKIPRKYFSGGVLGKVNLIETSDSRDSDVRKFTTDGAMVSVTTEAANASITKESMQGIISALMKQYQGTSRDTTVLSLLLQQLNEDKITPLEAQKQLAGKVATLSDQAMNSSVTPFVLEAGKMEDFPLSMGNQLQLNIAERLITFERVTKDTLVFSREGGSKRRITGVNNSVDYPLSNGNDLVFKLKVTLTDFGFTVQNINTKSVTYTDQAMVSVAKALQPLAKKFLIAINQAKTAEQLQLLEEEISKIEVTGFPFRPLGKAIARQRDIINGSSDFAMVGQPSASLESVLNNKLQDIKEKIQPLLDSYYAAKTASQTDEAKRLEAEINKMVDELNAFDQSKPEDLVLSDDIKPLPAVIDQKRMEGTKTRLINGEYVPQFIFAGAATRLNRGPMYGLDIWDIARELGKSKPEDEKFHYGMGPRQILAYRLALEKLAKEKGLAIGKVLGSQKIIINVNADIEQEVLQDFRKNNFYGFTPANVYFVVQPTFRGFKLENGVLKFVPQSATVPYGHGHNFMQLGEDGQAFTIDSSGSRKYLPGKLLDQFSDTVLIGSHRINDLTKLSSDSVISLEKIAYAESLIEQGYDMVGELVDNPNKQKGGNVLKDVKTGKSFLIETSNVKGNPKLVSLLDEAGRQGVPYNAFRLVYGVKSLKRILKKDLPFNLRFKDGYFYLEAVTGDVTQMTDNNAAFVSSGEEIHDFKEPKNIDDALKFLRSSDQQIQTSLWKVVEDIPLSNVSRTIKLENLAGKSVDLNISVSTTQTATVNIIRPNVSTDTVMLEGAGNKPAEWFLEQLVQAGKLTDQAQVASKDDTFAKIDSLNNQAKAAGKYLITDELRGLHSKLARNEVNPSDLVPDLDRLERLLQSGDQAMTADAKPVTLSKAKISPEKLQTLISGWREASKRKAAQDLVSEWKRWLQDHPNAVMVGDPQVNLFPTMQEAIQNVGEQIDEILSQDAQEVTLTYSAPQYSITLERAEGRGENEFIARMEAKQGQKEQIIVEKTAAKPEEKSIRAASREDVGGIDLNSKNLQMDINGEQIEIKFDQTMVEQFKSGHFSGIQPFIIKITPILNVSPLLGLKDQEGQLAKV